MPKHNVTTHCRKQLLRSVSACAGFPIRNKLDCAKISELIAETGLPVISESTLYRFFLWDKNTHVPYLHTLDTISKFCGFANFKEFEDYARELNRFAFSFGKIEEDQLERDVVSLLSHCIQMNQLKPLYAYTEQLPEDLSFDKKIALGEEFYFALRSSKKTNETFFKNFAKVPIVRESFFELWADPRFTIPGYEQGIIYYLKGLKPEESMRDLQDFVFANSLLFRHFYLTNRTNDAKKVAIKLFHHLAIDDVLKSPIHVFPIGRYIACRILHFHLLDDQLGLIKFWDKLSVWLTSSISSWDREQQHIVFFNIAEAFLFCAPFGDAMVPELRNSFGSLIKKLPTYLQQADLKNLIPYIDKNSSVIADFLIV